MLQLVTAEVQSNLQILPKLTVPALNTQYESNLDFRVVSVIVHIMNGCDSACPTPLPEHFNIV